MRTVTLYLFLAVALGLSAPAAHAGEGTIGPVFLERVTALPLGSFGQTPGNMEINLTENFTPPQGVTCGNRIVITTLRGADPDGKMFQLLLAAVTTGQPVILGITDDPSHKAFEGRCSLLYVSLLKKP